MTKSQLKNDLIIQAYNEEVHVPLCVSSHRCTNSTIPHAIDSIPTMKMLIKGENKGNSNNIFHLIGYSSHSFSYLTHLIHTAKRTPNRIQTSWFLVIWKKKNCLLLVSLAWWTWSCLILAFQTILSHLFLDQHYSENYPTPINKIWLLLSRASLNGVRGVYCDLPVDDYRIRRSLVSIATAFLVTAAAERKI